MSDTRPARPLCRVLSDWEVVQMYEERRRGTPTEALAERYGVSKRCAEESFRRLEATARGMGLRVEPI